MKKITTNQLYTLIQSNSIIVIDIREEHKFKKGHILNSINIPFRYLTTNPSKYLSKNYLYAIICDYGITSVDAANKLHNLGYNVVSIINGISKWPYGLST